MIPGPGFNWKILSLRFWAHLLLHLFNSSMSSWLNSGRSYRSIETGLRSAKFGRSTSCILCCNDPESSWSFVSCSPLISINMDCLFFLLVWLKVCWFCSFKKKQLTLRFTDTLSLFPTYYSYGFRIHHYLRSLLLWTLIIFTCIQCVLSHLSPLNPLSFSTTYPFLPHVHSSGFLFQLSFLTTNFRLILPPYAWVSGHPYTGARTTHQGPQPWRPLILLPSDISHWQPAAPQLGAGPHDGWLDLVHILLRRWELLCVPESSRPVRKPLLCRSLPCPLALHCSCCSSAGFLSLGCGWDVLFAAVNSGPSFSALCLLGVSVLTIIQKPKPKLLCWGTSAAPTGDKLRDLEGSCKMVVVLFCFPRAHDPYRWLARHESPSVQ